MLVSDIISKRIEDGLDTDVIYLDFQKAFDKVPHRRLLLKLAAAGIKGSALGCITDFLHNRKCRIKVNGSFSTKSSVKSGIPQGSVIARSTPFYNLYKRFTYWNAQLLYDVCR